MSRIKATLALITLLLAFSGPALAANLNTTSQWKAWLSDSRQLQRIQNQINSVQRSGTSAGYRQGAGLYDQMAAIHSRNITRFQPLTYSKDRAIAMQAKSWVNSRRISVRSYKENAQKSRNYAARAAQRGR